MDNFVFFGHISPSFRFLCPSTTVRSGTPCRGTPIVTRDTGRTEIRDSIRRRRRENPEAPVDVTRLFLVGVVGPYTTVSEVDIEVGPLQRVHLSDTEAVQEVVTDHNRPEGVTPTSTERKTKGGEGRPCVFVPREKKITVIDGTRVQYLVLHLHPHPFQGKYRDSRSIILPLETSGT